MDDCCNVALVTVMGGVACNRWGCNRCMGGDVIVGDVIGGDDCCNIALVTLIGGVDCNRWGCNR